MKLEDKFKFGKYGPIENPKSKGSQELGNQPTLGEMIKIGDACNWLEWYIDQPCQNSQYAIQDAAIKKSIKRAIDQAIVPERSPDAISGSVQILARLDVLESTVNTIKRMLSAFIAGKEREDVQATIEKPEEEWT